MRTLIQEMAYEKPLAAGRYRYERNGEETGAVEEWRLTEAEEGFRFLRVDFNAQETPRGDNCLYHLTLNARQRPERLKFRYFRPDLLVTGNVIVSEGVATLARDVNDERYEEEVPLEEERLFWLPTAAGLSLLANEMEEQAQRPGLTFNVEEEMALWPVPVTLEKGSQETVSLMGRPLQTQVLVVRWAREERTMWVDENRWPIRVQQGPLMATEMRYLRYRA